MRVIKKKSVFVILNMALINISGWGMWYLSFDRMSYFSYAYGLLLLLSIMATIHMLISVYIVVDGQTLKIRRPFRRMDTFALDTLEAVTIDERPFSRSEFVFKDG